MGALPLSDDLRISAYKSKFHHGFLDGFLIRDPQVIIFLRTDGNEAFTLGGVIKLAICLSLSRF